MPFGIRLGLLGRYELVVIWLNGTRVREVRSRAAIPSGSRINALATIPGQT